MPFLVSRSADMADPTEGMTRPEVLSRVASDSDFLDKVIGYCVAVIRDIIDERGVHGLPPALREFYDTLMVPALNRARMEFVVVTVVYNYCFDM